MTDVLVNHPHFGSLWLQNAYVQGDFVVGQLKQNDEMITMNFPRTCVRKWSTEHAPDCETHSLGCCDCGGQ